jgi:D-threo-aldose 1-dehydrogenase
MNTSLPAVGLGCAPLGGLFDTVDDVTARGVLDRAWERGVRYFDTAPLYGAGLSERRVGAALRGRPRDEFVLSTKIGRLLVPGTPDPSFSGTPALAPRFDFSANGIRRSLEESLERLQLERIDVALIHDPEDHIEAALGAVASLGALVDTIGVGTNSVNTALTFVNEGAVDCVLIAGRYTLLDDSAAIELLPPCAARGVHVIAGGVLNSGLLSGGTTFDYAPAPAEMIAKRDALEATCARYGVPLAAAAFQFPLRHPAISSVLVGARSAAELETDLDLLRLPIPEELWQESVLPQVDDVAAAAPFCSERA